MVRKRMAVFFEFIQVAVQHPLHIREVIISLSDLINSAQKQALELLQNNREALDAIAEQLQLHEVISGDAVHRIARQYGQESPIQAV